MPQRSPQEIRLSIETNREELARGLAQLRAEVEAARDWRAHVVAHRREVLIGAAVTGFVLGGGLAGIGALFSRS